MARDRLRDPGLIERQRTQARIASDIGIGGRVKVGNVGGGGGGFAALTPPAIGRGNRIEHVTLHAEESQTIASGGAGVTWDRIAAAPTELRGFASLVDDLADTGAVVAIPADVSGGRWITLELYFDTVYTGTVALIRTRNGADTTIVHEEGSGDTYDLTRHGLAIEPGDLWTVRIDPDVEATLTSGWIDVTDLGVNSPTSRAGQVIDLNFAYANGVVWDGANFWVTREDSLGTLAEIVKLDADGTVLTTYDILTDTTIAKGLDLLGTDFLVGDSQNGQVDRFDNAGTYVSSIAVTTNVWGVTTDGTHIWVTDSTAATGNSGTVRKYDLAGTLVDSFTLTGRGLFGIEHNGTRLLTIDRPNHTLIAVDEDGTVVSEKSLEHHVTTGVILGVTTKAGVPWVLVADNPNTASRLVEII